jgi:hypothetical protein
MTVCPFCPTAESYGKNIAIGPGSVVMMANQQSFSPYFSSVPSSSGASGSTQIGLGIKREIGAALIVTDSGGLTFLKDRDAHRVAILPADGSQDVSICCTQLS